MQLKFLQMTKVETGLGRMGIILVIVIVTIPKPFWIVMRHKQNFISFLICLFVCLFFFWGCYWTCKFKDYKCSLSIRCKRAS